MKLDIKQIIGKNVRKLRESKGLSQAEFAEKISLQMFPISQIENGRTYPMPETISKICEYFNISPACLFSIAPIIGNQNTTKTKQIKEINFLISEMDENKLKFLINILKNIADTNIKIEIK